MKKIYIEFFEYIYFADPHYTLSSERDHARATFKAHTSTDRVVSETFCIKQSVKVSILLYIMF